MLQFSATGAGVGAGVGCGDGAGDGDGEGDGEGDGVGSTFFGFELGVESESASFSKMAETSTSCMDSPSLSVRVASVTAVAPFDEVIALICNGLGP